MCSSGPSLCPFSDANFLSGMKDGKNVCLGMKSLESLRNKNPAINQKTNGVPFGTYSLLNTRYKFVESDSIAYA